MKYLILISALWSHLVFAEDSKLYTFKVQTADNKEVSLSEYKNKVLLIVNVASKCGFTYQYEGLQNLYSKYSEKGFVILGFPSNDFLGQEPGSNSEIQTFCKLSYGVNFPVFAKIKVKGDDIHPLYQWLTTYKDIGGSISWNFNKFLLNRQGEVVKKFGSMDKPESLEEDIKKLL